MGKGEKMVKSEIKVLLVEDSPSDAKLIKHELGEDQDYSFEVIWVSRVDKAIAELKRQQFDVALLDLTLPDSDGLATFTRIHATCPQQLPIIILTGTGNEQIGINAIGLGAQDYLVKGMTDSKYITRAIRYAIERKLATEALRKSEEYFKSITQNSSDVIIIVNKLGTITYVSPSVERFSGYKTTDLIGKDAFDFIAAADIDKAIHDFGEAILTKGIDIPNSFRMRHKNGSEIVVEGLGKNLLDDPVVKGFVMNVRDVTERKKMEEALQKSHDELELRVEERTVELKKALSEIEAMKDLLEAENIYFRQENKMKHRFENIIGQSDGLKYVLYRAQQVASMNTTVLILGETGTGKELIAAAIHNMSTRKERPLITVNCAALPGNLIESELFGREKGAFTGADIRRMGRFEVANGSTLCLDEIGELPLELQGKLLRVIQHNEFERLGSSQTIKVDVRIVATTNRNLEEEVRNGRFRQDLYYRLNVFPITVPPLRQRKDDIMPLVKAFTERYSRKMGKQITSIQNETMKVLQDYSWPGNIRELESVIERAVILCPGPVLELVDKLGTSSCEFSSTMKTLEETERNQILKILSETKWRIEGKDGAATILGIHPSTLRAKMHKFEIVRQQTKE
jgi:PAS domain S-box-containing protein